MNIQMSFLIIVHRDLLLGLTSPVRDQTTKPEQEMMSPPQPKLKAPRLNSTKEKLEWAEQMSVKWVVLVLSHLKMRLENGERSLSVPCVWRRCGPGSRYSSVAQDISRVARVDPR